MGSEAFLDTSFAIALGSPSDQHHAKALALSERIEASGISLVTTWAMVIEIGNSLARRGRRPFGCSILGLIENDPKIDVVPLSESLYRRGIDLYRRRPDKEWGLTDCISFAVMSERGITDALTADEHFRQAGFRPLLLEP